MRMIDCSLPGLQGPGNVVVADVDGGIYLYAYCFHNACRCSCFLSSKPCLSSCTPSISGSYSVHPQIPPLFDAGKEGCRILLSGLWPCDCLLQDEVNFTAFILQDKPGMFSCGTIYELYTHYNILISEY